MCLCAVLYKCKSSFTIKLMSLLFYSLKATLYSVRWYFGAEEFYRYVPKETPPTLVFPVSGINVDVSLTYTHTHTQAWVGSIYIQKYVMKYINDIIINSNNNNNNNGDKNLDFSLNKRKRKVAEAEIGRDDVMCK